MHDHVHDLRTLGLTGMADALETWQADPGKTDRPTSECLAYLIDAQRQSRGQSRADGFFRKAGLATHYSAATFTASTACGLSLQRLDHLRGLSWLKRGQTVVITGETRSGKTHLAAGLGHAAMVEGIRTLFVQTPQMLERCLDLDSTAADRRRYLKQLSTIPLLVMDDFATEQANTERTYLLRRLVDERSRRGLPLIVASINPPSDWDGYFEDEAAREGIYSRVLGGECHRVDLKRRPQPQVCHSHSKTGRSKKHTVRNVTSEDVAQQAG